MLLSIREPYLLTVQKDDFFPNPRREDENFGTMICFHRRYQLGDEHKYFCSDDLLEEMFINAADGGEKGKQMYEAFVNSFDLHPGTSAQLRAYSRALMAEIEKAYVVLPVYLLDHSGLSVSTTDFRDPWDSGQTGIIFASFDKIREEFEVEKITPEIRRKAENMLNAEVELYDAYLNGQCYGYELYKNGELQDSCWGFIGSVDKACRDIAEYLPDECKGMTAKLSEVNDIRLSVEDSKTDSLSISNQRLILREKALSLSEYNGGELMEFVDNGHTGMNFERPAVQELLALVQSGKIDCIIVKDLSRFGRNSIETGFFIERVFPLYHTRFISVSDDFDTQNYKGDTGGIDVAFKYLISECYSRDMSMKTRSAKYAKMRRGEYQSVICPYGYGKSADGRMEPDGVAADVVRTIFTLASKGISATDIGRKLYEEKIPTPGEYRAAKGRPIHDIRRTGGVWVTSTILRIIRDERYTGTYIIGKREITEIGGSHSRMKDESKWIKIPNHHEAIVSIDLYNRANKALRHFSQPNKQIHHYPLKGKVFCGYCDHAMSRKGKNAVFYCRHSEVSGNLPCYGLQIKAADLEKVIFDTLRAQLLPVLGIDADKDNVTVQTMQQVEYESKLQSLRDKKRMLYEQYVFDEIDLDAYKAQKDSLDAEVVNAKNAYTAISARTKQAEADYELRQKQQATARELSDAKSLTQSLSDRLISRVYIFKDNRIEIDYICNDFLAPN